MPGSSAAAAPLNELPGAAKRERMHGQKSGWSIFLNAISPLLDARRRWPLSFSLAVAAQSMLLAPPNHALGWQQKGRPG